MKKIDQLYRTAPVRNSPDALDSKILRQAELHIASRTSAAKPVLMSSWMPMAASCLVVTIGFALVLRSAYMDNGVDVQPDGYPEAIIDSASMSESEPAAPSLLESDSFSTRAQADSAQGVSGVVAGLDGGSADRQLLLNETPQYKSHSASKSLTTASVAARSEPGADELTGRASEDSGTSLSLEERAKPVQQIDRSAAVADIEDATRLELPVAEEIVTGAIVAEATMPARAVTERPEAERPEAERTVSETRMGVRGGITEAVAAEPAETGIVSTDAVVPSDQRRALTKSPDPSDIAEKQVKTYLPGASTAEPTDNDETTLAPLASFAQHDRRPHIESETESNQGTIVESNSRQDSIILVDNSAVDWLNGQPPSSYTLQLATASDDVYLAEFAQGITQLRQQQLVVLPVPTGNDVGSYTLLSGSFSSFDNAQRALARLPDRAQQFGARVRNVGVLQGILK